MPALLSKQFLIVGGGISVVGVLGIYFLVKSRSRDAVVSAPEEEPVDINKREADTLHRSIIQELGDDILSDPCVFPSLKITSRVHLGAAQADRCTDMHMLLKELEAEGTVSVGQYEKLIENILWPGEYRKEHMIQKMRRTQEQIQNLLNIQPNSVGKTGGSSSAGKILDGVLLYAEEDRSLAIDYYRDMVKALKDVPNLSLVLYEELGLGGSTLYELVRKILAQCRNIYCFMTPNFSGDVEALFMARGAHYNENLRKNRPRFIPLWLDEDAKTESDFGMETGPPAHLLRHKNLEMRNIFVKNMTGCIMEGRKISV